MSAERRGRRLVATLAGAALMPPLVLAALAFGTAQWRLSRVHPVERNGLDLPRGEEALVRGRHLVEVVAACTTCHGQDLGGKAMADDPWMGRLYAPNLTPGPGGIADWSDADLAAAIRHGVKRDGRPVVMMPAQYFYHLSDADLAAVVAHLRALPPVANRVPERRLGPVSALVIASNRAPDFIPAELLADPPERLVPPPPAADASYGAYLVETAGCKVCHHEDLGGGLHPLSLPGEPVPPDLTASGPLASWSEEEFLRTLRTGLTPSGHALDAEWMPWPSIGRMSDEELRAIFRHLRSLPPARRGA